MGDDVDEDSAQSQVAPTQAQTQNQVASTQTQTQGQNGPNPQSQNQMQEVGLYSGLLSYFYIWHDLSCNPSEHPPGAWQTRQYSEYTLTK